MQKSFYLFFIYYLNFCQKWNFSHANLIIKDYYYYLDYFNSNTHGFNYYHVHYDFHHWIDTYAHYHGHCCSNVHDFDRFTHYDVDRFPIHDFNLVLHYDVHHFLHYDFQQFLHYDVHHFLHDGVHRFQGHDVHHFYNEDFNLFLRYDVPYFLDDDHSIHVKFHKNIISLLHLIDFLHFLPTQIQPQFNHNQN